MEQLESLKILLMLTGDEQDNLLQQILDRTTRRMAFKSGVKSEELPDVLKDDVVEIAVIRFNRLKNEGMQSYSQEGESITFSDDDFANFQDDIDQFKDDQKTNSQVRFINAYYQG